MEKLRKVDVLLENVDTRLLACSWYGFDRSSVVNKTIAETKYLNLVSNRKVTLFYKDLDWDTNYFNKKSGEIPYIFPKTDATVHDRINILRMFDKETKYGFTTLRINALDMATAQAAQQLGYYVTDIHTSYFFDKRKQHPESLSTQYHVYDCPYSDERLLTLVKSIFSTNFAHRFHNDPLIPKDKADNLYVQLAKHCLETHSAVIVVEQEGSPVGFLTLQEHADVIDGVTIGRFGLAGVAPTMRGKQLYQNMILQGLHVLQDDIVETTNTAITNPVQRAWMNLKFKPSYVRLSFHKWKVNRRT